MENLSLNCNFSNVAKAAICGPGANAVAKSAEDENALFDVAKAAIIGPGATAVNSDGNNSFIDFIKSVFGIYEPIK